MGSRPRLIIMRSTPFWILLFIVFLATLIEASPFFGLLGRLLNPIQVQSGGKACNRADRHDCDDYYDDDDYCCRCRDDGWYDRVMTMIEERGGGKCNRRNGKKCRRRDKCHNSYKEPEQNYVEHHQNHHHHYYHDHHVPVYHYSSYWSGPSYGWSSTYSRRHDETIQPGPKVKTQTKSS